MHSHKCYVGSPQFVTHRFLKIKIRCFFLQNGGLFLKEDIYNTVMVQSPECKQVSFDAEMHAL